MLKGEPTTCASCRWFTYYSQNEGRCRRYPEVMTTYASSDSCGEYVGKVDDPRQHRPPTVDERLTKIEQDVNEVIRMIKLGKVFPT